MNNCCSKTEGVQVSSFGLDPPFLYEHAWYLSNGCEHLKSRKGNSSQGQKERMKGENWDKVSRITRERRQTECQETNYVCFSPFRYHMWETWPLKVVRQTSRVSTFAMGGNYLLIQHIYPNKSRKWTLNLTRGSIHFRAVINTVLCTEQEDKIKICVTVGKTCLLTQSADADTFCRRFPPSSILCHFRKKLHLNSVALFLIRLCGYWKYWY